MEGQTVKGIPMNDGGGLYDCYGLIDSVIVDCNELTRAIAAGEYVKYCGMIVEMVQKLSQLKKGIKNDFDAMKERINKAEQAQEVEEDG